MSLLTPRREDKPKPTCPIENTTGPEIIPFVGSLTYHELTTIISGACALLSFLIVATLIALHARNFSNRVQQRQIIRIVLLVPWVALFSFLIVWQNGIGEYLHGSLDFGCAIALSAFLLLMCDFVLAQPGGFEELFGVHAGGSVDGKASPAWLKRYWQGVLQFMPMSTILWIATIISLAVGSYCKSSNSPRFAHIWIAVLKIVTAVVAIVSSLKFYGKQKAKLQHHKALLKLFTFKGIIGLNAIQGFLISILAGQEVIKPSKYMTYHDIDTGLASFLLAMEMPIFSILLFIAFPVTPYKNDPPAAVAVSAIVDALNITDLLSAFVRGPMRLVREQQRQILRQERTAVGKDVHGSEEYEMVDGERQREGPRYHQGA